MADVDVGWPVIDDVLVRLPNCWPLTGSVSEFNRVGFEVVRIVVVVVVVVGTGGVDVMVGEASEVSAKDEVVEDGVITAGEIKPVVTVGSGPVGIMVVAATGTIIGATTDGEGITGRGLTIVEDPVVCESPLVIVVVLLNIVVVVP